MKQKILPEKDFVSKAQKKTSWMNLECVICNKLISKVFLKPHYKRSDIFFLFKKKPESLGEKDKKKSLVILKKYSNVKCEILHLKSSGICIC